MSQRFSLGTRIAHYGVLAVYALAIVLPIVNLVRLSFKSYGEILSSPLSWSGAWKVSNYTRAWHDAHLGPFLVNTAVVAVGATLLTLVCASMAAYVIAKYEFRGSQAIFLGLVVGMAMPIQMMAVPLFVLMRQLGLLNSLLSLILVYTATGLPFSIFLLVNWMRGIPSELEEAAAIDGTGPARTFVHIIMPLSRSILTTVGIFSFIGAWNGFFLPLILIQDADRSTVTVGVLSFVGQYGTQWDLLLPAMVTVSAPTVIAFIFASRQFVRNMNEGALKF